MIGSSWSGLFQQVVPWRVGFAAASVLVLAACTSLPGRGPTKSEIASQEKASGSIFSIVDLTSDSLNILRTRRLPTLRGRFGDYRHTPTQRIGVGDTITVTIWEAAAGGLFSAPAVDRLGPGSRSAVIPPQVVGRDGAITVPYAGRIRVANLRTKDVERAVVARLKNKAIDPQALVTVTDNASNTVSVVGGQTRGAIIPLNVRGQRLLDIIAKAGGLQGPPHESFVILARGRRVAKVPLQTVLTRPSENIYLRPRDVITLVRAPLTFTVVGAAGKNSVVPFGGVTLTLEEAVGKAGGLIDYASDPRGVFVLRYEPLSLARRLLGKDDFTSVTRGMVPVVYRVNMREVNTIFLARKFQMQDKDIVYVANSPITEIQKIFQLVNTVTQPAYVATSIANSTR